MLSSKPPLLMSSQQISRVTILGTGLIGGSFALALRKFTPDMHIAGWDRAEVVGEAYSRQVIAEAFSGELAPALEAADLVFMALPIGVTLDLLPEIANHAPRHALVTDACSTKRRIASAARERFPAEQGRLFLPGHPMAGRELSGLAHADANLFGNIPYALIHEGSPPEDPRVTAFVNILEKIGARPLWLGAEQHDHAVALASHLPQLAAVALGSFLYDHLDESGLPITLAGPGLRDSLRLAGSPYATWRDIFLTNREVLAATVDLFARRLEELRERLASRELQADFDAANEVYKLLRGL